jgi:hypothetical protein
VRGRAAPTSVLVLASLPARQLPAHVVIGTHLCLTSRAVSFTARRKAVHRLAGKRVGRHAHVETASRAAGT